MGFFDFVKNAGKKLLGKGDDSAAIHKEIEESLVKQFKSKEAHGKKIYEEFNVYVQQAGIVGNDIEIGFSADDGADVLAAMKKIEENLSHIEGVSDIGDNAIEGERELKLRVNEYGQQLGFSEGYVTSVLRGAFLKAEYTKMFDAKGLIRVKIEDINKDDASSLYPISRDEFRTTVTIFRFAQNVLKKKLITSSQPITPREATHMNH